MQIENGHKHAEVGGIPKDWRVGTLAQCVRADAPICYGILMPGKFVNGGIPVIKVRDISQGKIEKANLLLTDPAIDESYARSRLRPMDVLITIRGTTGRVAIVPGDLNGANITQDTARVRLNDNVSSEFLFHCLHSRDLQDQIALNTIGQAVKGINIADVKRLQVPLPPLAEQRAIAEALSDVDALINALDALITKKRHIKQGTMQQLLTGKKRLPGFSGSSNDQFEKTQVGVFPSDWSFPILGELVDKTRSIRYGIVQPGKFDPKGRLMVRGQDYSKGWVPPSQLFRVSDPIEIRYQNARLRSGDLIITIVGAGTGHVEVIPNWLDGANLTQTTARIAIDPKKANSKFCKHQLKTKVGTQQVANYVKGGAQPGLNCGDVERFVVPMPPTIAEQSAIAAVLSDMDSEIAALEQKRDKTKLIKQGMMQELLTGKTRLI